VLLNVEAVAVVLVDISLELLKAKCITFLVCPVIFLVFDLQALIGQMDVVISVGEVVVGRGGPDIAILVKINSEVVCHSRPNSDVELARAVQKWFLDVLLDHPERDCLLLVKDEVNYVLVVSEDLNASALVEVRWLDQPDVLLAVLERNTLVLRAALGYLSKPMHEFLDSVIVIILSNNKRRGGRVKNSIARLPCLLVALVVVGE
jgi:hypothetical protein